MPYIGKSPEHGNFSELTDVSGSFNGSTTQFALTTRIGGIAITPVVESALLISLDGVIQEPTTDYTVSGTNITFTTAPASTVSFFGVVMGRQLDVGTPSDGTITQAKLASTFMTGASDIGGAIADADLFFIDDGAGGTLRKTAASRLKTYIEASTMAVTGNVTATGTVEPAGDTAASDNAAFGYTSVLGAIITGQGSTNDVTLVNDADATVLGIATGTTNVDVVGDLTAGTLNADGDTSAGDNAAMGYTAAEGLILTGQGSTSDITLKNDADETVFSVPTGTDDILFPDGAKAIFGTSSDLQVYHDSSNSYLQDSGTGLLVVLSNHFRVNNAANSEVMFQATEDGGCDLYHNNVTKLATTANGATITGTVLATTDTDTSNTGSVTLDFAANQNFVLTLTGNVTLANPSTEQVGQSGVIVCIQDGTGSRTLSLGTDYETAAGGGITLSTAGGALDVIPYFVSASARIQLGAVQLAFS